MPLSQQVDKAYKHARVEDCWIQRVQWTYINKDRWISLLGDFYLIVLMNRNKIRKKILKHFLLREIVEIVVRAAKVAVKVAKH